MRKRDLEHLRAKYDGRHAEVDTSALRVRISKDLDVVKDAYDFAASAMVKLKGALANLDHVDPKYEARRLKELMGAYADTTKSLIALRDEGRTTIRESVEFERQRALISASEANEEAGTDDEQRAPDSREPEQGLELPRDGTSIVLTVPQVERADSPQECADQVPLEHKQLIHPAQSPFAFGDVFHADAADALRALADENIAKFKNAVTQPNEALHVTEQSTYPAQDPSTQPAQGGSQEPPGSARFLVHPEQELK